MADALSDCEVVPLTTTITRGKPPRNADTCRVSLLKPDSLRTYWHYLARCPKCGRPHLGRARDLERVTGTRRLPCGHWIVVVVARTYAQDPLFLLTPEPRQARRAA